MRTVSPREVHLFFFSPYARQLPGPQSSHVVLGLGLFLSWKTAVGSWRWCELPRHPTSVLTTIPHQLISQRWKLRSGEVKEAAQGKGSQMSASLAALDSNNSDTPATPMPSETSAALTLSHAQASGLLVNQTEPIGTRSCAVPKSRLPSLASFLIPPSQLEEVRRPSDPEHCPHSQGEKQVTSTGSVDEGTTRGLEPQSARFSWLNDFRHGILPLTLSFLICRMGTVIKMFTPSVAVHNRESMDPTLGMGQALRK